MIDLQKALASTLLPKFQYCTYIPPLLFIYSNHSKMPIFHRAWSFVASSVLLAGVANSASVSATPAQTFTGIGGSGAWWPNDLFNFPEATRQNLSSLLFSQNGLGLSSYRYNIGAGGVNVSNPTRAPETFYVSPGVYNFAKDAQGVYFLQQAANNGVSSLTAFANSAPAALTSGKASCNGGFVTG
jgi:hypothetical protein